MTTSRYVKSADQIKELLSVYAAPKFFQQTTMNFLYETKLEAISALLPPPLQPTDSAVVTVSSGVCAESNCISSFSGTYVLVPCKYNDIQGSYVVHMIMDTDRAIIFGRETMGEPKKFGRTSLATNGVNVEMSAERLGTEYIKVKGTLDMDLDTSNMPDEMNIFFFKSLPACDGSGLEFDPILVMNRARVQYHWMKQGKGEIQLEMTDHDFIHELECIHPLGLYYGLLDITGESKKIATVNSKDFLPYAFGNIDDYLLLNNINP
jgi:acetoacetate decarboxylase